MIRLLRADIFAAKKSPPLWVPGGPQPRPKRRGGSRRTVRAQDMMDAMGIAVILVTPDRDVLLINKIADKALNRGDGLVMRKQQLGCLDGVPQTRLAKVIAAATGATPRASSLLLDRPGGTAPYQLTIMPAPQGDGMAALIVFRDPDDHDVSLPGRLRSLFALTATEADLAVALSQGASLSEIAGTRTVRASTVRSQIKSIAAKMRCSRQAEIAAIVARLPPLPPREP